jgi:hypothetical protein
LHQAKVSGSNQAKGQHPMKRGSGGEKKHLDIEKVRKKKEVKEMLRELLEYSADEDDFLRLVKSLKPEIGQQELRQLIELFRDSVREKRGLP